MKGATIQDVAGLAGVSLSTVSAVLNGKNIVSEDTKARVLEAVAPPELSTEFICMLIEDIPGPGAMAGLKAIRRALKTERFTAVVAITDMVALGVYRGLCEAGLRIPQDASVVGFDNTYLCEFMNAPLTTVHIPRGRALQSGCEDVGRKRRGKAGRARGQDCDKSCSPQFYGVSH